jgi:hypothetical protein
LEFFPVYSKLVGNISNFGGFENCCFHELLDAGDRRGEKGEKKDETEIGKRS